MQLHRAVLLGGAGFIGSALANHFATMGWEVTVIDGLLPRTGGSRESLGSQIRLIDQPIEAVATELPKLFNGTSLVIDCMGWTRHLAAQYDPFYDLSLNVRSHLAVIRSLGEARPHLLVYLGSRHQYGRATGPVIFEDTPFLPNDVQSVHKAAADNHYRIAAERF